MLKLVPFNDAWIDHGKLDLKAIYRRPRWTKDEFDQDIPELGPDGLPLWDLTGPLPVKQHNKWKAKGFEYVTLADRNSLIEAYKKATLIGGSVRDYDQHQTGGPWNYKMYAAGQSQADNSALLQLRADVERFGSDAVESIRRRVDPKFTLPKNLQGIEPGGELPPLTKPAPKKAAAPATTDATEPRLGRRRKSTAAPAKKKEPVSA